MEILREKLEEVAKRHLKEDSLYGLDGKKIQGKKLRNVQEMYNITEESVLFLYDDTLFGSAKDGLVFTNNGIYWREKLGKRGRLTYRELVESTVSLNSSNKDIYVLNKASLVNTSDLYYNIMADLKSELVSSLAIYETYYKNALDNFEQALIRFAKNDDFNKVIGWLNRYEGLFLSEEDKSLDVRKVSFQAYLNKAMFIKAKEELDVLENKDPEFFDKAKPLLKLGIKENEFYELNVQRLRAIEIKNFDLAYSLIKDQEKLEVRTDSEIEELKLETRKAEYESLNEDRLRTIDKEEYDIGFLLLEKQKELNIKDDSQIEQIKKAMHESKKQVIESYHEDLKLLVNNKYFDEADNIINHIYNIDPYYNLEKEEILIQIYKYEFDEAEKSISQVEDSDLKEELEKNLDITAKTLYEEIRNAARDKDYNYFVSFPIVWNFKDDYGMFPIDYFALEGDEKGLLLAIDKTNLTELSSNVYGHNFIDLLGFACDSTLGNKDTNILEVLYNLDSVVYIPEIASRIDFIQTGNEGLFFSYCLSTEDIDKLSTCEMKNIQAKRLSELNKTLLAGDKELIENQKLISQLKAYDDYPIKDEFETLDDYKDRWEEFASEYIYTENINPSKENDVNLLNLMDLYFPIILPSIEIGTYDSEKEVFYMIVRQELKEMGVPISIAKEFKESFYTLEFSTKRFIEKDKMIDVCIYHFAGEKLNIVLEKREIL